MIRPFAGALLLLAMIVAPARASRSVYPDAAGNLHVFMVGADGRLYHDASTGRGAWRGFESLGGNLLAGRQAAVARNADGRLDVFAVGTDNALWHIWELSPGGAWSAWTSLGGQLAGAPDVAINTNGWLEVFSRGPGNALVHKWQLSPGGSWSDWSSLGGILSSEPAVIPYSTGALVVWARGTTSHAHHIWQFAPHSSWSAWADDGGLFASTVAPSLNADGRQEAFGIQTDGLLNHRWQTVLNGDWAPNWSPFPGVQLVGNPAVALDSAKQLHVFARGSDNALWHAWQTAPNSGWRGPDSLGGQFSGDPVLVKDRVDPNDGALHVLAAGADGALYESYQDGPTPTEWSPFASLGRAEAAAGPPPLVGGSPPAASPRRLVVTLGFTYSARKRSTRLKSLVIKDVPRGGTVDARCARGCSRKSLVKRNLRSTRVSLEALVKRPLKVGTKITITATAPGTIGAVKTLTIRSRKAPKVITRCLPPGTTKAVTC